MSRSAILGEIADRFKPTSRANKEINVFIVS